MLCKEKLTKNAGSCTTYFIRQFLFGIDPFFHKCVTHHIKWACPEQDRKVGGYVNVLGGIDFFLLNFETVPTVWYVFFISLYHMTCCQILVYHLKRLKSRFLVLNATFSYIMATSFSGGRRRSTMREPTTMCKQLVNFIACGCESSAPFF